MGNDEDRSGQIALPCFVSCFDDPLCSACFGCVAQTGDLQANQTVGQGSYCYQAETTKKLEEAATAIRVEWYALECLPWLIANIRDDVLYPRACAGNNVQ